MNGPSVQFGIAGGLQIDLKVPFGVGGHLGFEQSYSHQDEWSSSKGPIIKDVLNIFEFLDPLPPCLNLGLMHSAKSTQPPFLCLLLDQPPLIADVICTSPVTSMPCRINSWERNGVWNGRKAHHHRRRQRRPLCQTMLRSVVCNLRALPEGGRHRGACETGS